METISQCTFMRGSDLYRDSVYIHGRGYGDKDSGTDAGSITNYGYKSGCRCGTDRRNLCAGGINHQRKSDHTGADHLCGRRHDPDCITEEFLQIRLESEQWICDKDSGDRRKLLYLLQRWRIC